MRRAAQEVITVSRRNKASTILITHDLDVGIMMGDRIAVLPYEAKGIAKVIDGPAAGRFDMDFPKFDRCANIDQFNVLVLLTKFGKFGGGNCGNGHEILLTK